MADLLDGVARYLADRGLMTYLPDSAGGDCFLEGMPPDPDECVVLTLYGGPEPDALHDEDTVSLQVRARGTRDPRVSRARVHAIYSQLHGERHFALPDGTWLILAVAIQTPASLGVDDNGRHEHVCNFRLETSSPTVHRPE